MTDSVSSDQHDGHRPGRHALNEVIGDFREIAAQLLRRERSDHTLQPTALVNEAMLRIRESRDGFDFLDSEFRIIVARTMRHVLIDHARRRAAQKRGGGARRVTLRADGLSTPKQIDVIELDEALHRLASIADRAMRVVELRFFAGLTMEEVARVLDISVRTAELDWRFARAWLRRELQGK
ncbi:MAG: ECF-type sigma factor [Phycisphaerales bacterium]